MKITVKEALEMLQAISQLDSYQNGGDKPTLYVYGGDTRLRIAIARRKLRALSEDYTQARNNLLLEITEGTGELPPPGNDRRLAKKHLEFMQREKELLEAEVEIDIEPLPSAAFKLDENPIPPSVLDMLGSFIGVEDGNRT
jgi:hypothetical protein